MSINPIHRAPYTNFHDLNLDWIIEVLNEFNTKLTNFVSLATIKYADPIQWDITSQYEANTVVVDSNGNAYLSVQPVPSGVSLDRTEYWTKIGNFDELWANVKKAITPNDEGHSSTATAARAIDDLVWVNGMLVRVTKAMNAGDAYVKGSNCVSSSTNEVLQYLLSMFGERLNAEKTAREEADTQLQTAIDTEKQAREEADNTLQNSIETEKRAREDADNGLQNRIDTEKQAREDADSGIQNSIDKLQQDVKKVLDYANVKSYGAVGNGSTDDTAAFKAAIATGKDLYIPDGVYMISDAINIGSPLMTSNAIVVANGIVITMGAPVAPCTLHFRVSGGGKYNITVGETIADWFLDTGMSNLFAGGSLQNFTGTIKFPTPGNWNVGESLQATTKYVVNSPLNAESHITYDFCGSVVAFTAAGVIQINGASASSQVERTTIKNATFIATEETCPQFLICYYSQRINIGNLHCIGGRRVLYTLHTISNYIHDIVHDAYYASNAQYVSYLLDETSEGAPGLSGNASIRFYNCISSFNSITGDSSQFILFNSNDIRDVYITECECSAAATAIRINTLSMGKTVWNIFIKGYIADQCERCLYVTNAGRSQITVDGCYFNTTSICAEFDNSCGIITNCQFVGSQSATGVIIRNTFAVVVKNNQFINIDRCIQVISASQCEIAFNSIHRYIKYQDGYAIQFVTSSNTNRLVYNSVVQDPSVYYTAAMAFDASCSGNVIGLNTITGTELSNQEADLKQVAVQTLGS